VVEWEFIAPMIMGVVLIVTIGGVVLLKPVMNRLVELLEVMASARSGGTTLEGDISHMRDLLERMDSRMALLEDRQDFTERLLRDRAERPKEIPDESGRDST